MIAEQEIREKIAQAGKIKEVYLKSRSEDAGVNLDYLNDVIDTLRWIIGEDDDPLESYRDPKTGQLPGVSEGPADGEATEGEKEKEARE